MLDDLIKERVDKEKPRKEGLTYIIDKLQGIDKENFKIISPLIDIVKIYGAFPLLVPDTIIKKKIEFYHEHNVLVSTAMTISEFALQRVFERFIGEAAKIGFDIIELGENSIALSIEDKEK
jgi:phosphosulfolactate synthase